MKKAQQDLAVEHIESASSFSPNDSSIIQQTTGLSNRPPDYSKHDNCNTCAYWQPEHYGSETAICKQSMEFTRYTELCEQHRSREGKRQGKGGK